MAIPSNANILKKIQGGSSISGSNSGFSLDLGTSKTRNSGLPSTTDIISKIKSNPARSTGTADSLAKSNVEAEAPVEKKGFFGTLKNMGSDLLSGLKKLPARTGVEGLNLAASTVDYTADLVAGFIERSIRSPMTSKLDVAKPSFNQEKANINADKWVNFFDNNIGDKTEGIKLAAQKLRGIDSLKPTKEWSEASFYEKFQPQHVIETVFQVGPGVIASLGAFAINIPLGFAVSMASVGDDVKTSAMANGVDEDTANSISLGTGLLVAAIDRFVPNELFGQQQKGRFMTGLIKRIVKTSFKEAGTEVVQEDIQIAVEATFREDLNFNEIATRNAMAGLGGFLGGAGAEISVNFANQIRQGNIGNVDVAKAELMVKNGEGFGKIQQKVQAPDLTKYENAMNSGDMSTVGELATKYPNDARFQVHKSLGMDESDSKPVKLVTGKEDVTLFRGLNPDRSKLKAYYEGGVTFYTTDKSTAGNYAESQEDDRIKELKKQKDELAASVTNQTTESELKDIQRNILDINSQVDELQIQINKNPESKQVAKSIGTVEGIRNPLKNPLVIDAKGQSFEAVTQKAIEEAKQGGNDGVVINNVVDAIDIKNAKPVTTVLVFDKDGQQQGLTQVNVKDDISAAKIVKTVPSRQKADSVLSEQVRNAKDIKGVSRALKKVQFELNASIMEAEGKAVAAQELRGGLNTKNIAKLKAIYAANETFQKGDIETIRASKSGVLLDSVIENVQEVFPYMNEQEAFDHALNLPSKADETPKVLNKKELLKKEKLLSGYLDTLKTKQKELNISENNELKKEWKEVLSMQEELRRVVEVPSSQLPVGEGIERVSRLEARMKGKLDALKLDAQKAKEELGLTTYNQLNREGQRAKAAAFVINSPEEAMRVMRGEIDPPTGLLKSAIYIALKELGSVDTELATNLATLMSTRAGQEINYLQELDPDNPVTMMENVVKTRIEAFERRTRKNSNDKVKEEIKKIDKELSEVRKAKPKDKNQWSNFLESIKC